MDTHNLFVLVTSTAVSMTILEKIKTKATELEFTEELRIGKFRFTHATRNDLCDATAALGAPDLSHRPTAHVTAHVKLCVNVKKH